MKKFKLITFLLSSGISLAMLISWLFIFSNLLLAITITVIALVGIVIGLVYSEEIAKDSSVDLLSFLLGCMTLAGCALSVYLWVSPDLGQRIYFGNAIIIIAILSSACTLFLIVAEFCQKAIEEKEEKR